MKNLRLILQRRRCCLALSLLLFQGSRLPGEDTGYLPPSLSAGPEAPSVNSRSAVLLDAATGTLLYAKNEDEPIPPASLTKLMTIHLALREVAAGRAALDEPIAPPRESWAVNQPPRSSLMFLAAGQRVSLRELILGLAVPSGNDAAVAVALRFAPSVEDFTDRMNREARRLGLEKTRFAEPSGISEYNVTTALEFARFCRIYLREHPETLEEFHSVTEFAYPKAENVAEPYREKPGTIPQANHNRLLGKVEGVDGLKTGYIDEAGYNIALTAERRGFRLIAVILGAPAGYGGDRIRDEDGRKLLTWGFGHFTTLRPDFGPLPPLRVWKGKTNFAAVVPGETPEFTAPIDRGQGLRWEIEAEDPVTAPFPAGTILGDLVLYDRFGELRRLPLVSANPVPEGNILQRLRDSLILLFRSPGKGKRPVAAGSSRP